MAITIQNIVEESLKKLGNTQPDPQALTDGLTRANNIIFSWNTEFALDTPITEFTSLATSFTLGDNWRRALISNLAVELSEDYDYTAIQTLQTLAAEQKQVLKRTYLKLVTDGDITDAKELIYMAFRKVGELIPNADEQNDALVLLNNIITAWNEEFSLDTPVVEFATLATTFSSLSLSDDWKRALMANLSIDLAETWKTKVPESLVFAAKEMKEIIRRQRAKYVSDGDITNSEELLIAAFRKTGLPHPSDNELNHSLSMVNDLIQTWNEEFGLDTPIVEFTDLTTTLSSISMGDEWKRPLVFNLAVELAINYGRFDRVQFLQPIGIENKLLLKNLNSRYVTDSDSDTAQELLIMAYRKVGKPNPNTNELNHGLTSLNNMVSSWKEEYDITYLQELASLAATLGAFPLYWKKALIYNIAVELAEDFPGTKIPRTVFREAERQKRLVDRFNKPKIEDATLDPFLNPIYNARRTGISSDFDT